MVVILPFCQYNKRVKVSSDIERSKNGRVLAMVSEQRSYSVINTEQAKKITSLYLTKELFGLENITFGLPEIYDRYDIWNVPVLYKKEVIGEIAIDAYTEHVDKKLSSDLSVLGERRKRIDSGETVAIKKAGKKKQEYKISELENMLLKGRSENVLKKLPEQSVDMIFTSPPYYNARKQYSEYQTYEDYLTLIRKVVRECHRVLMDGKFFVINSSHVLVPRASRNESSSRIAVPFDIHQIFMEEGFEFIDDIIWEKPEGAGWASGRGRRFSADRNPMQYKAVPVTEYVMVYRKKPALLIDYFIRNHPDQSVIQDSKIADDYEKTNVWYISPARDKRHPAIFPKELAEKVIKYYSFKNDVVLDPFGGIGTTAKAAVELQRRFVLIECSDEYIKSTQDDLDHLSESIRSFHYQYMDYSELLSDEAGEGYDLYEMLRELEKKNIPRKDIAKVITEAYSDILNGEK